jgi:hypothetical protein
MPAVAVTLCAREKALRAVWPEPLDVSKQRVSLDRVHNDCAKGGLDVDNQGCVTLHATPNRDLMMSSLARAAGNSISNYKLVLMRPVRVE